MATKKISAGEYSTKNLIKETGGMKGESKGVSKKLVKSSSGKGMKGSNPYFG